MIAHLCTQEVIFDTFDQDLGHKLTPEVEVAWTKLLVYVMQKLKEGFHSGLNDKWFKHISKSSNVSKTDAVWFHTRIFGYTKTNPYIWHMHAGLYKTQQSPNHLPMVLEKWCRTPEDQLNQQDSDCRHDSKRLQLQGSFFSTSIEWKTGFRQSHLRLWQKFCALMCSLSCLQNDFTAVRVLYIWRECWQPLMKAMRILQENILIVTSNSIKTAEPCFWQIQQRTCASELLFFVNFSKIYQWQGFIYFQCTTFFVKICQNSLLGVSDGRLTVLFWLRAIVHSIVVFIHVSSDERPTSRTHKMCCYSEVLFSCLLPDPTWLASTRKHENCGFLGLKVNTAQKPLTTPTLHRCTPKKVRFWMLKQRKLQNTFQTCWNNLCFQKEKHPSYLVYDGGMEGIWSRFQSHCNGHQTEKTSLAWCLCGDILDIQMVAHWTGWKQEAHGLSSRSMVSPPSRCEQWWIQENR